MLSVPPKLRGSPADGPNTAEAVEAEQNLQRVAAALDAGPDEREAPAAFGRGHLGEAAVQNAKTKSHSPYLVLGRDSVDAGFNSPRASPPRRRNPGDPQAAAGVGVGSKRVGGAEWSESDQGDL